MSSSTDLATSTSLPRSAAVLADPLKGHRVELDFLRGVAILLVMGFHYSFPKTGFLLVDWVATTLKSVGGVGVDLFFTLSGFLVGGLLLKEYKATGTINARRFLVRRAFKIWPALYVLVGFHVVLGRHSLDAFLWQNVFHVQNYFGTSIKQTWSLAVEEHFYLGLAVLLWFMVGRSARTITWTLVTICAASITARIAIVAAGDLDAAFRQTQYRIDSLLYGVLLAHIFTFYPRIFAAIARRKRLLVVGTLALVFWIYATAGVAPLVHSIGFTVQGIGFCLVLVLVHEHSGALATSWWYRLTAWIGVYSYGIYLWHTLSLEPGRKLIALLESLGVPALISWNVSTVAQFAVGVLAGYVMTKLVEWPFLRLRERVVPAAMRG
jgi:peptidoglycan/LPS O-acetylase OafA/YrhL